MAVIGLLKQNKACGLVLHRKSRVFMNKSATCAHKKLVAMEPMGAIGKPKMRYTRQVRSLSTKRGSQLSPCVQLGSPKSDTRRKSAACRQKEGSELRQ